jgi:hypothetical protein
MTTALIVVFLIAHGLVHLAIWLPKPDEEKPQPFVPSRSAVLSLADVGRSTAQTMSVALAAVTAGAFAVAGTGAALAAPWTAAVAVTASLAGLVLKVLYFHPWLSLGVLLDALVLSAALSGWPIALT